jgi:hypothetical protein
MCTENGAGPQLYVGLRPSQVNEAGAAVQTPPPGRRAENRIGPHLSPA